MWIKRTLSALACALLLFSPQSAARCRELNENVLRLHIIANSDSERDQAAKLAVRDAVLSLEADMAGVADGAEAKEALMADGGALLCAAEETLAGRGMDYGAQLIIGEFDFPDRMYGEKYYPAGRYEALRIVLGEGAGHNWWCVMFPPLCILELPGGKVDYEGLEEEADIQLGTMKFSSFVVKLLKSIDGGKLWKRISGS